jgi:hypothetical protein
VPQPELREAIERVLSAGEKSGETAMITRHTLREQTRPTKMSKILASALEALCVVQSK